MSFGAFSADVAQAVLQTISPFLRIFYPALDDRYFSLNAEPRNYTLTADVRTFVIDGDDGDFMLTTYKDPESVEDFVFDWTKILAGDTITGSAWEITGGGTGGVVASTSTNDASTATARLTGGVVGVTYTVKNLVTLASGQRKARSILVKVLTQ